MMLLHGLAGCAGATQQTARARTATPAAAAPAWIREEEISGDMLCGLGIAGAGFDAESPYPKQLSQSRAINNLAGILGTQVQEAIIDQQSTSMRGVDVQLARVLHVDDELLAKVESIATTEYWLDLAGEGPFTQKNFTYAHACISAKDAQGMFKLDPQMLKNQLKTGKSAPDHVPSWVASVGKQPGGRVCAVGFSLPAFFADKTFDTVVDDVRGQLAQVIQTLVGSYYEEVSNGHGDVAQEMTVASTDALAKGVIVTHYWHDRDGRGPNKQKETTYGWGCVYPVDVVRTALNAAAKKLPESERDKVAAVRQRAEKAFGDLDAEEAKHPGSAVTAGVPTHAVAADADQ